MTTTTKEENQRQYEVVDQLLSMHSIYRDRLELRAFLLNSLLVAASLILCAASFINDEQIRLLGWDPNVARLIFGGISVVVLIFAIAEFRVDWKSVAGKHALAVHQLGELKVEYRTEFSRSQGQDEKANRRLTLQYKRIMKDLVPVPERQFVGLKKLHQAKKALSRRIAENPTSPVWFLRFVMCWEGLWRAWRDRKK
jgi:hypothetical protein